MTPVILRTHRLVLSLPTEADIDPIFAACQDPAIQRYTTVPSPYARTDAEGFVAKVPQEWEAGQHLTWVIREDDVLVGTIGLYRVDGKGAGDIGYWMAPGHRGGGRLVEAANAVIDWGFHPDALDLARIGWQAVAGNIGSARVAQRLGFRYEGMLRQALTSGHGRDDGWVAGLLREDDRSAVPAWPVLID